MKFETLIKRFSSCGYSPKGLPRDEECQSIIKWLYEKHYIFVSVTYMHLNFHTKPSSYLKFVGTYRYHCGEEIDIHFVAETYFDNPYDAYYDALRHMLPGFKFQCKYTFPR